MESRKKEIRELQTKSDAQLKFKQTQSALIETLKETYPTMTFKSHDSQSWFSELQPFEKYIFSKDERLVLKKINVLIDLNIPSLWVQSTFSDSSKNYLWDYLSCLYISAKTLHEVQKVFDEVTETCTPNPELQNLPANVQELVNCLPKTLIEKVQHLESPDQLTGVITPEDMAGMMKGVAGLFQSKNPKQMRSLLESLFVLKNQSH